MSDYKESKDNPLHKEYGIWNNTRYIIIDYFKEMAKQGKEVDAQIEGRIKVKE